MKRSRRELSIDMVVHKGIFKNNQITLFLCFTYKTGVSFYFVPYKITQKQLNSFSSEVNLSLFWTAQNRVTSRIINPGQRNCYPNYCSRPESKFQCTENSDKSLNLVEALISDNYVSVH